jgi:hypothetical protein
MRAAPLTSAGGPWRCGPTPTLLPLLLLLLLLLLLRVVTGQWCRRDGG